MGKYTVDETLFSEIDKICMSERMRRQKDAVEKAQWRLFTDRAKLAVESWQASAGEDIQMRRAKLFKNVVELIPISILDFDRIAGRSTTTVIGCHPAFDICGDYIKEIHEDDGKISLSISSESEGLTKDDLETMRECARVFKNDVAPVKLYDAWRQVVGDWAEDAEAARLKDPDQFCGIYPGTTTTPMWDRILAIGFKGIIAEAEKHITAFQEANATDIDRLYFWKAAIISAKAVIALSHRYADLANRMAKEETDEGRKSELVEIARICKLVPEYPPETFREALQFISITGLAKNLEHPAHGYPHWGRADQYLYRFFKNDLTSGILTLEECVDIMSEMIGKWGTSVALLGGMMHDSHQINFMINNIMIGGIDGNDQDASNELSYLILHTIGLLKQSSPTLGLRWNRNTPRWLMKKAIETNIETRGGIPLFENDEVIVKGFVEKGYPFEEAAEWCGLGCVYPSLPTTAEHSGTDGVGALNLAAVLDLALHNGVLPVSGKKVGVETGDPRTFKTFDDFYNAFKEQHRHSMNLMLRLALIARQVNKRYVRLPFASIIMTCHCMETGQDLLVPDPDYHAFGLSDRAIVDVGDSLMAIKKLIYDEKKITMDELLDAIDGNFEGDRGGEIRQMCLSAPKYGNDIEEVDLLVGDVGAFSAGVAKSFNNGEFKSYMISREGLAWHYFGGLGVGALPNGRKALEPLNDGAMSPMRGMDRNGPTAVIRSVLKTGFEESLGSVLNQKFAASLVAGEEGREKLLNYTDVFFKNGGQHIQYNITDSAELKKAKLTPEEYRSLIVRIGGFSAFFTQLSPEIQDDVIDRSEYTL